MRALVIMRALINFFNTLRAIFHTLKIGVFFKNRQIFLPFIIIFLNILEFDLDALVFKDEYSLFAENIRMMRSSK